jgi:hypothetical protein
MKSATSYLQGLCQANRGRLRDAGLWWPGTRACFQAVEHLSKQLPEESEPAGAWRTIDQRVRQFDGDVLISNEMLLHRDPARLAWVRDVFEPAEVRVVITARDLGRVLPSQWQTTIRSRGTVPWTDYAAAVCSSARSSAGDDFWRRQDLVAAVDRWRRIVPLDRIRLVTVPPAGSDHRIVAERFLAALGHRPIGDLVQPRYRKLSLGAHSAELLRRLNEQTLDWAWSDYRFRFKVVLSSMILEQHAPFEPGVQVSAEQWSALSDRAAVMIDGLERIGVDVVGDLSDLKLPMHPPADGVDPQAASAEHLLDVAGRSLVELTALLDPKTFRVARAAAGEDLDSPA